MGNVVNMADYRHNQNVQDALEILSRTELRVFMFVAVPEDGSDNIIGTVANESADPKQLVELLKVQQSLILEDYGK